MTQRLITELTTLKASLLTELTAKQRELAAIELLLKGNGAASTEVTGQQAVDYIAEKKRNPSMASGSGDEVTLRNGTKRRPRGFWKNFFESAERRGMTSQEVWQLARAQGTLSKKDRKAFDSGWKRRCL